MLHGRAASRLFRTKSIIPNLTSYESITTRKFSSRAVHTPRYPFKTWNSPIQSLESQSRPLLRSISQNRHQSTFLNTSFPASPSLPPVTELNPDSVEGQPWTAPETLGEPYVGYLKDFGVDFGWGPSSCMQWVFEHIHVLSGTPMWASVILMAILYRAAIFNLIFKSSENAARMGALQPITARLMEKMKEAMSAGDKAAAQKAQAQLAQTYRNSDVKFRRMAYPLLQIPFGFGVWRLLRTMASIPIPELATGGVLWFPNLIQPDPLFILPCLLGASIFLQFRIGGQTGVETGNQALMMTFKWILPFLAPIFVSFTPAIIQLSFAVNAMLGLLTAFVLRNPTFRRTFKMSPMVKPAPTPKTASTGFMKAIRTQGIGGYFRAQRDKVVQGGIMAKAAKKAKENEQLNRRKVEIARSVRTEQSRKEYESKIQSEMARRRKRHSES